MSDISTCMHHVTKMELRDIEEKSCKDANFDEYFFYYREIEITSKNPVTGEETTMKLRLFSEDGNTLSVPLSDGSYA